MINFAYKEGLYMAKKQLFICTKPYQYLVCRLIVKGYNYRRCDIIVLNHFDGAKEFVRRLKKLEIWNSVYFFDDSKLNRYSSTLNIFQKVYFYNKWMNLIPQLGINYNEYDILFIAHDSVAVEYGIMRYFNKQNKKIILYEEGYANYVDVNAYNFVKHYLKEKAHLFNIPGSYMGRLKFVDKILLQYPELVNKMNLPIAKKVYELPIKLSEFINYVETQEELSKLFPEMSKLPKKNSSKISLFLGESSISNKIKNNYIKNIIKYINNNSSHEDMVFIKQHPGKDNEHSIIPSNDYIVIPKIIPIELFSIYIYKNNIKSLCIYTFGSAAAINLYLLLKNNCNVKIVFIKNDKICRKRYKKLSRILKIKYDSIEIS